MSEATHAGFKDNIYKKSESENEQEISTSSDDTESSVENIDKSTEVLNKVDKILETVIKEVTNKLEEEPNKDEEKPNKDEEEQRFKKIFNQMPFYPASGIYTPVNKMTMELFKHGLGEKIVKDLKNYNKFHKNTANKHIHYWALYCNIFYTLALLSTFNTTFIKVDFIVYLLYIVYYKLYGSDYCSVFMGGALGSIFTASKFYTLMLPNHVWYSLIMCLNSWCSQFIGHAIYEKNSPALTKSLTQAFTIAPVHFAVESVEKLGGIQPVLEGMFDMQMLFWKKTTNIITWYNNWKNPKNKKD